MPREVFYFVDVTAYRNISTQGELVYYTVNIDRPPVTVTVGGHRHCKCKQILNWIGLPLNRNCSSNICDYTGFLYYTADNAWNVGRWPEMKMAASTKKRKFCL